MTATESIRNEYARGPFAFWPAEHEAAWRAKGVLPKQAPAFPNLELRDKYGFPMFDPTSSISPNQYGGNPADNWATWEAVLEAGKSYLVGDGQDMATFIRLHRSPLTHWQKIAFAFCMANPLWKLEIKVGRNEWKIYRRGEYVDFSLPHQDAGGEPVGDVVGRGETTNKERKSDETKNSEGG